MDHAAIAARIPHSGSMCLLQRLESHDQNQIRCSASSHRDAANPLRLDGVLPAACAVEYAAQAMALHGALAAPAAPAGGAPTPGFLASVRSVRLRVARLDDVAGDIRIHAERLAGDTRQALYSFALHDERGALLVEGRATVILNALP